MCAEHDSIIFSEMNFSISHSSNFVLYSEISEQILAKYSSALSKGHLMVLRKFPKEILGWVFNVKEISAALYISLAKFFRQP